MRLITATTLTLFLAVSTTTASGSDEADQIDQVRCAETAFSDALENGDWDAFESLIHAEARFASGSSPARVGASLIRQQWERSYSGNARDIRWRSRSIEIIQSDQLALSRGPYRFRSRGEDGEVSETWGTFNSIWVKEGERWQVVFDLGSDGTEDGDHELIETGGPGCPSRP